MRIEPNHAVELQTEYVMIDPAGVLLHDGGRTPVDALAGDDSAFSTFCRSLDPNRCFITALIPDDAARPVFFQARQAATRLGLHMQATVDTPDAYRRRWESYRQAKAIASVHDERPPAADPGGTG